MWLKKFPTLSRSDCFRFQDEFEGDDLIQKLEEYVEFRKIYNLDELRESDAMMELPLEDAEVWKWASDLAIKTAKSRQESLVPGVEWSTFAERICNVDTLPQMCFAPRHEDGTVICTVDGHPVLSYLAARLDLEKVSPEVHAPATALYLERVALTHSFDTQGAVFLVDTRAGAGWANHPVFNVIGEF